jgi:hypothetical protein
MVESFCDRAFALRVHGDIVIDDDPAAEKE